MLDDRLHDLQGQLGRDGEADTLGAAGLGEDRRVDADQVAGSVHQRAAGVAGVDRRVGLDEVFVGVQAELVASGGADDAHGHGLADAERVADGEADVAGANAVGAAEGHRRQVLKVDLQHGQVGFRVAADQLGDGFAAVAQGHDDLVGASGHVVVGQQVAFRAHDHRRAEARLHALLLRQVVAEEAAEHRVVEQGVGGLADHLGGVQVGHCRSRSTHRVGIGHRAFLQAAEQRRLLDVHLLAWQADQLGVVLDDQQGQQHADQHGPAEETQGLGHRENPWGCEAEKRPIRWRPL
ncbi:hypothetical protein PAERUG_P45_London_17_VIM_2_12_12_04800 [Pseudomonas aeruginosa]|nr:hypothetical protein PAERUG_P45_London_17_VIM_2_12_12_04800 [Pseudomonas aeruginosa]